MFNWICELLLRLCVALALVAVFGVLIATCLASETYCCEVENLLHYEYECKLDSKQEHQIPSIYTNTKEGNFNSPPVWKKIFPKKDDLILIGRMKNGIVKWKNGVWWECGKRIVNPEKIEELALKYAYVIVKSAYEASDGLETNDPWILNAWGLAGTIMNESRMDRCALGLYPRKYAYKLGLIKKNKLSISHSEEEVLRAINDPRMKKRFSLKTAKVPVYDLGTTQLLTYFYSRPYDYESMLEIDYSTEQAAHVMRTRSRRLRGKYRPWIYWRGSYTPWYDEKITRLARKLGARKDEI